MYEFKENKAGDSPNKGLWNVYVNTQTNESSYQEHTPKLVKQWCAKGQHNYLIVNMSKRLAECSVCGQERNFIVGKHTIDGDTVLID